MEDPAELRQEAHVQHTVRFVEHQYLDVVESRRPLVEVVVEPPGRGDDHLDTSLEGLDLRVHPHPSDHDRGADVAAMAEPLQLRADLQRQLSRRRQDQGARPVLAVESLEDRQRERQRLPRAGGRATDHVLALQRRRHGLRLDGRGGLEPRAVQRSERLRG